MLYRFCRGVARLVFFCFFRLRAVGRENIPSEGAVVLCCNHISNWDPITLGTPLERKVHYMAKAELFSVPGLGWLIRNLGAFPVKRGGVSKESIRTAIQILKDGHMLGIFPQGSRSNASGMGKKGAASLAMHSHATVIPATIIGNYKLFSRMTLVVGKPVDLTEFSEGTSQDQEAATEKIMDAIRELSKADQA